MSAEYKQCPDCRFVLPVADFYRAQSHADGLFSYCKDCAIQRARQWDAEHPERALQHRSVQKRRRRRNDPEAVRLAQRTRRAALRARDPERVRELKRREHQRARARKNAEAAT